MKVFRYTFKGLFIALVLTMLAGFTADAQRISGKVLDADNQEPLIGANITVKETSKGASADINGAFTVEAVAGQTLVVSYVGFTAQNVLVGTEKNIVIALQTSNLLQEITVSALGFQKDKAKTGYASQDVKGNDLLKAREPNAVNALTGKVAGLTVGGSPELLRAPAISLRGSRPIFVVDGVPINSDTWNINADDIETYTVLKGPGAAALYGFRSSGGVIMITTKKGLADKKGVRVEFNTSQMIESGFNALPKVQDEYGPGDHGRYGFVDGRGGGLNDGDYDIWGPRFEGQALPQYDSPIDPVTGVRQGTPWTARGKDNLTRFLRPGFLSNNNINVTTSTDKLDMRYSTSYNYQQGMVPNTQLNVANFNVYSGLKVTDRIKLEANMNYNRQFTDNIPDVNYGPNSLIYNITIWGGADWDVDQLKNYWQEGKEGVQQNYAEYQRYNNPWFVAKEWLRGHQKTDVYGQTALTWNITKGLDLKARTAITTYDLFRSEKLPYSATTYGREEGRGDYREDKRTMFENNSDVFLNYDTKIGDAISLTALAGGAVRSFNFESSFTSTNYLNVPGLYSFSNSANPLYSANFRSKMLVQSGYYSVDLGIKNFLFLTHTGRVDHLSTLPKDNNTFYYPSLGGSLVISNLADLGPVSFLKLRGSFANVKSALTQSTIGVTPAASYPVGYGQYYESSYDGPSYSNSSVYSTPLVYDNKPGAYFTNQIVNTGLQPSSRTAYEGGLEAKFFLNRLGLDFTYFQYIDGPQIFSQAISEASGYSSQLINAVKTQTTGFEVSLNATPVKNKGGLTWDVLLNWSTFKNTFKELPAGQDVIYGFFKAGDRTDKYYDRAFVRTNDGQIVNDASGRPIYNPVAQLLGNTNPDWVWSAYNKLSYKNVSLGFQFDGRVGGVIRNYIQQQTFRGGRNIQTVEGAMGAARLADWENQKIGKFDNPKENGHWTGEGVQVSNGVAIKYDQYGNITNYSELQFASNTTKTFLQDYISRYYNSGEGNLMSRTFSKLREVTVTYQMPATWFEKNKIIRSASISLVGRNLLYFAESKDIDLDNYLTGGQSSLQSPTAKRYGFNLNITF
jgi:TonB-linked SusC/RagA family outer membrane protein